MSTIPCMRPMRGVAIRITQTDHCGRPLDLSLNPKSQIATPAFITMGVGLDQEENERFRKQRADGTWVYNIPGAAPALLGTELSLEACDVPLAINELVLCSTLIQHKDNTGERLADGFVLPGYEADSVEDDCDRSFIFELWTRNGSKNACGPDGEGVGRYIRWITPLSENWKLDGELTFEANEAVSWNMMAYGTSNPNFQSPVGLANDPDLTQESIEVIQRGGPLAAVFTNTLPDLSNCDYAPAVTTPA